MFKKYTFSLFTLAALGSLSLAAAEYKLYASLEGHVGSTLAVAFNSDTTMVAAASDDNNIRIWNVATSELITTLKCDSPVHSIKFTCSPFPTLAAFHTNGVIELWNATQGNR